ncbi:V-type proton ATPase proteolipid subunit [Mycena chlorophos]|uniref:V-type proton ATPase proteolipid subunit n=1 Tax=Mycena chlorophos TaxID=658473 RepID=A0A8H6TPU2_MYCCL|nr:V-type proton ATPase proteolipid subunit [Mycena chlorophos]
MSSDNCPVYAPFFSAMVYLGATSAIVFSCNYWRKVNLSSDSNEVNAESSVCSYGTAKSGVGVAALSILRPDQMMKSVVPVVMAGIIAIYGLVVAVLIVFDLDAPMALAQAFTQLGAGLSVGLAGLSAGFAIGIVGDAGIRGTAQQPRLYVGMILVLIFAEVLALYGLIVALVMNSKAQSLGLDVVCRAILLRGALWVNGRRWQC